MEKGGDAKKCRQQWEKSPKSDHSGIGGKKRTVSRSLPPKRDQQKGKTGGQRPLGRKGLKPSSANRSMWGKKCVKKRVSEGRGGGIGDQPHPRDKSPGPRPDGKRGKKRCQKGFQNGEKEGWGGASSIRGWIHPAQFKGKRDRVKRFGAKKIWEGARVAILNVLERGRRDRPPGHPKGEEKGTCSSQKKVKWKNRLKGGCWDAREVEASNVLFP